MNKIALKDYLFLSNEEHKQILEIRNKKYIREVSLDTSMIEFANHMAFVKSLENSDKKFWAVIYDKKIVGGVNVFEEKGYLKWGIFFEEATSLIVKSVVPILFLDFVFENYKKDEIYLDVKKRNTNTISYDKNLGFEIFEEDDKIVQMKMSKQEFEKAKEGSFLKRILKQLKKFEVSIV